MKISKPWPEQSEIGNEIEHAHFPKDCSQILVKSDEEGIRKRVRKTLDACMKSGGYCLGTGNSVANYIPLENYLAMLDEGKNYM